MQKHRVLQLVPDFSMGGAERLAVHLVTHLDPERFDVAAVSISHQLGTDLEEVLRQGGYRVWYLNKGLGFKPRTLLEFDRIVRSFRPHVVHTHIGAIRYALPSMVYRRVPARVHTMHNLAEKEAGHFHWVNRIAFRLGVVPVAIAEEVKASISRFYSIHNCPNIHNGIPVQAYQDTETSPLDWRKREGFSPDDFLFLTVGRLHAQKNHALLIKAFARVHEKEPRTHLLIVGEGRTAVFRAELEELARTLNLQDHVHLLGRRTDIPEVLAGADVFVLSSDYEGNPLTVMEAMAAGKPVISTAVGGVPELVEDGESGLLVAPGDASRLAEAMIRLLTKPDMCRAMGLAGVRLALEHFDVHRMVREYQALYERLIGGG